MAERVQMGESEANSVGVVGADERCSTAVAPDVDANERHGRRRETGDQRIVVVDADEIAASKGPNASSATCRPRVDGLEQQRVVAGLREPPRDRGEHLPEEDQRQVAVAGVVADDDRDESRLLRPASAQRDRPCSRARATSRTRSRVCALTSLLSFSARETVAIETPARSATSLIVGRSLNSALLRSALDGQQRACGFEIFLVHEDLLRTGGCEFLER